MKRERDGRAKYIEKMAEHWRLIDNHGMILFAEAKANRNRIQNLEKLWKSKSSLGLLPNEDRAGIIEYLKRRASFFDYMLDKRFDRRLVENPETHQYPYRSYEHVYELTDELHNIHRDIAICERAYWQRLERYEIEGKSPIGDSTIAEYGDIQQIYNAADYLCMSYYKKIAGRRSIWNGMVIFGVYHEFRRREPYFFAPNYVKTTNYRMWNYFSHEVSHQLVEDLMRKGDLTTIHEEIVGILMKTKRLSRLAMHEYVATEIIADIMSVLISGEEYILTLSELKYYPSLIRGESKFRADAPLVFRPIRIPMFLRALVSCWTIRIAWGFIPKYEGKKFQGRNTLKEVLTRIIDEDDIVKKQIKDSGSSAVPTNDLEKKDEKEGRKALNTSDAITYLNALHNECLHVVREILRKNIIQRLKRLIKSDFYGAKPTEYYFKYKGDSRLRTNDVYFTSKRLLAETQSAQKIQNARMEKVNKLEHLERNLQNFVITHANPVDVIAALSRLSRRGQVTKVHSISPYDHAAILTIVLFKDGRKERYFC